MSLSIDAWPPAGETAVSHQPAGPRAIDEAGSLNRPDMRGFSYLAECQCPDDCPRDHENE